MDTVRNVAWETNVTVLGKDIPFKMDMGAEVTVVSEETHLILGSPHLEEPSKVLCGPGHKPLSVRGKFISTLAYKERAVQQPVYVVEGLQKDLLGLPAITGLNLAVRVDTAQTPNPVPNPALSSSIRKSLEERLGEKYPRIFKALGNLGDPYFIKLCDDAQPLAIYTPRSVPLPLRDKVKEELERMENLGVISRVEEPTPWCERVGETYVIAWI